MTTWDPVSAKVRSAFRASMDCLQRDYHSIQAQFRLTAQRLGQLRDRKDAQRQVIGRDISILLQQGNETLARAKAQRLIQDEIMGDLLESLEMQIGVLLEHFSDFNKYVPTPTFPSLLCSNEVSQRQCEPRSRGSGVYCHIRGATRGV